MSEARERSNRAMLRVRDTIDRDYDTAARPRGAGPAGARLPRPPDPHVPVGVRGDPAPLPPAPAHRAGDVPAAHHGPDVTDVCLSVGFTSLGTFSRLFSAVVGQSPSTYARGAVLPPVTRLLHDGLDPAEHVHARPVGPGGSVGFGEAGRAPTPTSVAGMKLSYPRLSSLFVLDQDQALDFYVGVLGLEVGTDADLGFMRWLTVKAPGDDREILLERPGPPAHDPQTAEQVRELLAKGAGRGLDRLPGRRRRRRARRAGRARRGDHPAADRPALRPRHGSARPVRQPPPDRQRHRLRDGYASSTGRPQVTAALTGSGSPSTRARSGRGPRASLTVENASRSATNSVIARICVVVEAGVPQRLRRPRAVVPLGSRATWRAHAGQRPLGGVERVVVAAAARWRPRLRRPPGELAAPGERAVGVAQVEAVGGDQDAALRGTTATPARTAAPDQLEEAVAGPAGAPTGVTRS